jgi:hypothetical protein
MKDKQIRDEQNRRQRGQQAQVREKCLFEEKKKLEEDIQRIERKKVVAAQESTYAHSKAL